MLGAVMESGYDSPGDGGERTGSKEYNAVTRTDHDVKKIIVVCLCCWQVL